jgi:NAD(P)-dependent dehydrogenase (short-subunit alcohol dehydrogenase family)
MDAATTATTASIPSHPLQLAGQVALITGAAGGIGSAIARAFVRAGAVVGLLDLAGQPLTDLASELGQHALALPADITQFEEVAEALVATSAHFGSLSCLVNAVGVLRPGRIDVLAESDWDLLMNVNVKGVFLACKAAVPLLKAGGGGTIINISSVSAHVGSDGSFAYAATKGAVLSLTYGIAQELGPFGIRVNAICPGWVDAGFTHQAIGRSPDPAALVVRANAAHVLGRMAAPSEVADAAVFLASPQSSFVTGTALYVDGGFMIKR